MDYALAPTSGSYPVAKRMMLLAKASIFSPFIFFAQNSCQQGDNNFCTGYGVFLSLLYQGSD
eukprot:1133931-Pelagomonas_calceolata.AAC.1